MEPNHIPWAALQCLSALGSYLKNVRVCKNSLVECLACETFLSAETLVSHFNQMNDTIPPSITSSKDFDMKKYG